MHAALLVPLTPYRPHQTPVSFSSQHPCTTLRLTNIQYQPPPHTMGHHTTKELVFVRPSRRHSQYRTTREPAYSTRPYPHCSSCYGSGVYETKVTDIVFKSCSYCRGFPNLCRDSGWHGSDCETSLAYWGQRQCKCTHCGGTGRREKHRRRRVEVSCDCWGYY